MGIELTAESGSFAPETLAAGFGALAYGALTLYLMVGILRHADSRAVLFASTVTFAWMLWLFVDRTSLGASLLGLAVYLAWILVLLRIIGGQLSALEWRQLPGGARTIMIATAVALLARGILTLVHGPLPVSADGVVQSDQSLLLSHLLLTILALGVLDQVRGNISTDHLWRVKFLVLGLFVIFVFDLVLYTDALLFAGLDPVLAAVQPSIYALAAPLIAIAVRRHRHNLLSLSVSRQLAFQSTALVAAGGYLLLMSAAGYYLRLFGGQWGDVLQTFLLGAGLLGLVVVALSRDARGYLRRMVANHLFEQRYDYREEWQRLTRALVGGDPGEPMEVKAIRVLTDLLSAPGGAIWVDRGKGSYVLLVRRGVEWREPLTADCCAALRAHFEAGGALVDLGGREAQPVSDPRLPELGSLSVWPGARFVLPLPLDDGLWGVAVLSEPKIPIELDEEDRDLLDLVTRQTASFLAQRQASEALAQSRQLDAFNQMNAFVVHDVKTVVSQLALLVRNADKHRDNPAFLDDVIATTRHAVERMEKLLAQLRERRVDESVAQTDVIEVCREAVGRLAAARPRPLLDGDLAPMMFSLPHRQMAEVLGHLLQNAIDATPAHGSVTLSVERGQPWHRIVIEDTGCGMSPEFIESRLFAPFESTKGLSAMGIGVYQARQLIRSLGGDILVESEEGVGTRLELLLPCQHDQLGSIASADVRTGVLSAP